MKRVGFEVEVELEAYFSGCIAHIKIPTIRLVPFFSYTHIQYDCNTQFNAIIKDYEFDQIYSLIFT